MKQIKLTRKIKLSFITFRMNQDFIVEPIHLIVADNRNRCNETIVKIC